MYHKIEVVYENGVLRPLGPLPEPIREHQRLTVTLEGSGASAERVTTQASDASCAATLEEVRAILSRTSGSLAEAVAADREER